MPASQSSRRIVRTLGAAALVATACVEADSSTGAGPLPELDAAIERSGRYLIDQVEEDGRFVYMRHVDPEEPRGSGYNILRHAGAIYAMADYLEWGGYGAHPNLIAAAGFLRSQMAPIQEGEGLLGIWSDPAVHGREGKEREVKLGGAGLGLAALVRVEELAPGTTPLEELRGLAEFIRFMQKNDGSFNSKYTPSKGGRDDSWTSLYYPGEAALGLLLLHGRLDPEEPWLRSAEAVLDYLARSRRGSLDAPADHWALLATGELLRLADGGTVELSVSRDDILDHLRQVCDAILDDRLGSLRLYGFSGSGRTTPAATRLEGLQAALTVLPAGDADRDAIRRAVDDGIAFLLDAQVLTGPRAGAVPRVAGAVRGRDGEVRVDYVQHALSAWIQYSRLLGSPVSARP